MPDPPTRRPKQAYKGSNGFLEAGRVSDIRPNDTTQQSDAVERHRFAQYILTHKGSLSPSLDAIKAQIDRPVTSATVKERIQDLQKLHAKELQDLYEHQATQYWGDALDKDLSRDDAFRLDPEEKDAAVISTSRKMESLYKAARNPQLATLPMDNELSMLRYSHLQTILPLQQRRVALEAQEADLRRRRDAQFPSTIQEYHDIRSKDVKLRVARFLTLSEGKDKDHSKEIQQEKMMNEFGWAWRQVQPLCREYANNTEFKTEIQDSLREVEVRDPRKKPSIS